MPLGDVMQAFYAGYEYVHTCGRVVVKGRETSAETTARVIEISKQLGKTPVEVNDAPGFVSNRVLMPMINEAILCVQEKIATPEAVDQVMTLGM